MRSAVNNMITTLLNEEAHAQFERDREDHKTKLYDTVENIEDVEEERKESIMACWEKIKKEMLRLDFLLNGHMCIHKGECDDTSHLL